MPKAKLKDLVEALEMQGLEISSYVNLRTGEVATLTDEELTFADDDAFLEDLPEWMVEARRLAKDVLHSGDYLTLPDQGLISATSIFSKSLVLRVTRVAPLAWQMAAICPSAMATGLPRLSSAAICRA